ncbi:MAG: CPXCG motif-containing cysteine-rich protein [Nodosilinea sp.]
MESTAEYYCAVCGEPNTTFVDLSAGLSQSYTEDCQVCCRPNLLYVTVDEQSLTVDIATEYVE